MEQLIDDQPEFGMAVLQARLLFAHLIGRGQRSRVAKQPGLDTVLAQAE